MATEEVIITQRSRRYNWPEAQLNLWIFIVLGLSASLVGIFAWFMSVQTQMHLGTPWLFPFMVTSGSLALLFLLIILILASRRFLIPGVLLIGSFILFVLWLTGLIETAIQLYGSSSDINGNCSNLTKYTGVSIETLAYLTQNNICGCWKAAFGLEVVGVVFFLWLMVMSWQVNQDNFDD